MPLHILRDSSPHQEKAVMLQRVYYHVCQMKKEKKNEWTWVSSSICKEIGSQPFVLKTSKKLNRWKTQQLSLDHKRRDDTGQAIATKTGEIYR